MVEFPVVPVSPKESRAFKQGSKDESIVLQVQPPKDGPGIEKGPSFLRAVHHVNVEEGMFSSSIESGVFSFEMWYHEEELDFYFVLPDRQSEDHYRRQLSGYYPGLQIEEQKQTEDKFIPVESGRAGAAVQLGAKKHIYEPLSTPGSEDSSESDPYRAILNEVDSRKETTILIQILYKPLSRKWTRIVGTSLEEFGQRVEEDGVLEERLFGFFSDRLEDSSLQQKAADAIREQNGEPAFLTEVRLAVFADTKQEAQNEIKTLFDLFERTYQGPTGQTLTMKAQDTEDLLARAVLRERVYGDFPRGTLSGIQLLSGTQPYLMCTPEELSGLVHLPNESDIPISGINYTDSLSDGTLPPESRVFEPVSEEEKQEFRRNSN